MPRPILPDSKKRKITHAVRLTAAEDAKLAKIAPSLGVSTSAEAVRILVRKAIA